MSKTATKIIGILVTYAALAALLYLTCRYRLAFTEGLSTFYYDTHLTSAIIKKPAGLAIAIGQLVTQLFAAPTAAVCISAALLTLAVWLTNAVMVHITKRDTIYPLSILPAVALCMVQPDIYCGYSYTISFILMLAALAIVVDIRHERTRLAFALLLTPLLMHAAGAVTTVFAVSVTAIEVISRPKLASSWMYALSIVMVIILSEVGVLTGVYSDIYHGMSPESYYTQWFTAPASLYLPWATFSALIIYGCILGRCPKAVASAHRAILAIECAIAVVSGAYIYLSHRNPADELYAELMLYSGQHDWDRLSERYQQAGIDDSRLRNLYNLSLAERGQLSKVLFQQQCTGTETLLDTSSKRPDQYMLLGDIYYSMGHMSLALKHTFEANEGLGNYCPRLLKRLVDINLITGQYAVAEKYINLLSETLQYDSWAADRRLLLYDDAAVEAHSELGDKRRCLIADDRFAGIRGIESDLIGILRSNPSHTTTMEYLGALTLLSKNVPLFAAITDEFYGTPAMPSPLPKHYQEAIAIATLATDERLDIKYGIHPSTVQRCHDFWARHQDQPGTFWHYLKFGGKPQK